MSQWLIFTFSLSYLQNSWRICPPSQRTQRASRWPRRETRLSPPSLRQPDGERTMLVLSNRNTEASPWMSQSSPSPCSSGIWTGCPCQRWGETCGSALGRRPLWMPLQSAEGCSRRHPQRGSSCAQKEAKYLCVWMLTYIQQCPPAFTYISCINRLKMDFKSTTWSRYFNNFFPDYTYHVSHSLPTRLMTTLEFSKARLMESLFLASQSCDNTFACNLRL